MYVVIGCDTLFTCIVKKRKTISRSASKNKRALTDFGKRLKTLRKKVGHSSQLGFAYENGFNVRRYGSWELGADIKLTNVIRICDALGISVAEFFSEGFDKSYNK